MWLEGVSDRGSTSIDDCFNNLIEDLLCSIDHFLFVDLIFFLVLVVLILVLFIVLILFLGDLLSRAFLKPVFIIAIIFFYIIFI